MTEPEKFAGVKLVDAEIASPLVPETVWVDGEMDGGLDHATLTTPSPRFELSLGFVAVAVTVSVPALDAV